MRTLLVAVLLGGCFASASSGTTRPGVMPMLSELPRDPAKRDDVLDSANTTAGPEQRKGMTTRERKAETAAATAAAILGSLFSKTQSVTIGSASQFDESELVAPQIVPLPQPSARKPESNKPDGDKATAAKPDAPPANDASTSNGDDRACANPATFVRAARANAEAVRRFSARRSTITPDRRPRYRGD